MVFVKEYLVSLKEKSEAVKLKRIGNIAVNYLQKKFRHTTLHIEERHLICN